MNEQIKYKIHRYTNIISGEEMIEIIKTPDFGGGQFVPHDDNSDYREYLAWVAEGNTAEEWDPGTAE